MTGVTGVGGDTVQQAAQIADLIRAEAEVSSRPGQYDSLYDIAEKVEALAAGLLAVPASPAATVTISAEQAADLRFCIRAARSQSWPMEMAHDVERRCERADAAVDRLAEEGIG